MVMVNIREQETSRVINYLSLSETDKLRAEIPKLMLIGGNDRLYFLQNSLLKLAWVIVGTNL